MHVPRSCRVQVGYPDPATPTEIHCDSDAGNVAGRGGRFRELDKFDIRHSQMTPSAFVFV